MNKIICEKKIIDIIRTIICVFILTIGLYNNFAYDLCESGIEYFDWWSNGIMISDLMYYQNYEETGACLNIVSPGMLYPEDNMKAYGLYEEMFRNNEAFEVEQYVQYTSNIVVQRFLYRFMSDVLPVSNSMLLTILGFMNCFLAAITITIILNWISGFTNNIVGILIAILLVLFCPYFAMYGRNLYWCMGIIFLPMASMIHVIRKFEGRSEKQHTRMLVVASFFVCLLKQLFYFEFVSTVMIAMTIPMFYYCICNNKKIVVLLKNIISEYSA